MVELVDHMKGKGLDPVKLKPSPPKPLSNVLLLTVMLLIVLGKGCQLYSPAVLFVAF